MPQKLGHTGSLYLLFLGIPLGLFTIAFIAIGGLWLLENPFEEFFITVAMVAFFTFVKPVIGLTAGFLLSAWWVGRFAEWCFLKGQGVFLVSLKSSFVINFIMWLFFSLGHSYSYFYDDSSHHFDPTMTFIIPGICLVISTIITTLTWGLLICFLIKRRLKKKEKHNMQTDNK